MYGFGTVCVVTGYSSQRGSQTLTREATDLLMRHLVFTRHDDTTASRKWPCDCAVSLPAAVLNISSRSPSTVRSVGSGVRLQTQLGPLGLLEASWKEEGGGGTAKGDEAGRRGGGCIF